MAGREVFWNISLDYIVYILAAIAVAVMVYAISQRYRLWRVGKADDRAKNLGRRIWSFICLAVVDGLVHRRFLRA